MSRFHMHGKKIIPCFITYGTEPRCVNHANTIYTLGASASTWTQVTYRCDDKPGVGDVVAAIVVIHYRSIFCERTFCDVRSQNWGDL
jgi:hypothetical protein